MHHFILIRNPSPGRSLTSSKHLKNPNLSPTVEFLGVLFPHQMESMSNGGILCAEEQQNITITIIIIVIVTKTIKILAIDGPMLRLY